MDFEKQMDLFSIYWCRVNALYSELAKIHGIGYNTMLVLYAIRQSQPCTQKQISEEWSMPKQTVHTVIKSLNEQGYVAYSDGRNQKEKLIRFTAQGEKYMNEKLAGIMNVEVRVLEQLGAQQCRMILKSMEQYTALFEREVSNLGK